MLRLAIALAALALAGAGCSSDGDSSSGPASAAAPTTTQVQATTGEAGPKDAAEKPCTIVPASALAAVFAGTNPPKGASKPMGDGFATCTWEGNDTMLLVSVVPAANLQSDYKGQLNIEGPVQSAVLADAVSFPGTVGVEKANSKGTTVGFTAGDTGYLVAVRTGKDGDDAKDLPLATQVSEAIVRGS